MTESETITGRLPNETLTMIFRCLLKPIPRYQFDHHTWLQKRIKGGSIPKDPRDRWLARFSYSNMADGRHRLVPVSQTCRRWNTIANEILYTEVDVKENDDSEEYYSIAKNLASTLAASPHLGSLVRRVNLGTWVHDFETTTHHIEVLRGCPLVEDVKIHGYNGYLLEDYRPVVASLKNLRTLNISRYCLADRENDIFINGEELLVMLKGFPRLEQFGVPFSGEGAALKKYCKKRGIEFYDRA